MTPAAIVEHLRAEQARLADTLPELRAVAVSVGSHDHPQPYCVSGHIRGQTKLSIFNGASFDDAAKNARHAIDLALSANPQPTR